MNIFGMQIEKLEESITPLAEASGLEIVDVEFIGAGSTLRIYIDREKGVTVDDCAAFSRVVSDVLDVEFSEFFQGRYNLEISSPGLDRAIKKPEDFVRFIGKNIKLKTFSPINGQRNFKGKIKNFKGNTLILQVDKEIVEIDRVNIFKANLVIEGEELNAMGS